MLQRLISKIAQGSKPGRGSVFSCYTRLITISTHHLNSTQNFPSTCALKRTGFVRKFHSFPNLCYAEDKLSSKSVNDTNRIDSVRWFYATDTPLKKANIAGWEPSAPAAKFAPFSEHDSARLEKAHAKAKEQPEVTELVPVLEDYLFEVDLNARTLLPVYWDGPIFEVRRGTWFSSEVGSKQMPCPEPLAEEIEKIYQQAFGMSTDAQTESPRSILGKTEKQDDQPLYPLQTEVNSKEVVQAPLKSKKSSKNEGSEEPESGNYVTFDDDKRTAWVVSNDIASVIRKLVSIGGSKIVRGFDSKKKDNKDTKNKKETLQEAHKQTLDMKSKDRTKSESKISGPESLTAATSKVTNARPIDHLVICIHGIGQKLGQRIESVNFAQDISVFRKLLSEVYVQSEDLQEQSKNYIIAKQGATSHLAKSKMLDSFSSAEAKADLQTNHRVQVIPLIWRHDIQFGMTRKDVEKWYDDEEVSLEDLTVDGVLPLRNIIADVALDVLLYYQPKYHSQIINATTKQLNKLYNKFCERNPEFAKNPRVSLIGHSLGSAIGFDIVCAQDSSAKNSNSDPKPKYELDFDVDVFFGVGSPVGMFQLLKGNRIISRQDPDYQAGISKNRMAPKVQDYYNIFHPSDPVAYRVDPLVHRDAASLTPNLVPFAQGTFPSQIQALQQMSLKFASEATCLCNTADRFSTFNSKSAFTDWVSVNSVQKKNDPDQNLEKVLDSEGEVVVSNQVPFEDLQSDIQSQLNDKM